jgi:hypothetical protein
MIVVGRQVIRDMARAVSAYPSPTDFVCGYSKGLKVVLHERFQGVLEESGACTDIDGTNIVTVIDSKIHAMGETASQSTSNIESRQTLGVPKRCRGDSTPLDIEFCPPPVAPLGIVLL